MNSHLSLQHGKRKEVGPLSLQGATRHLCNTTGVSRHPPNPPVTQTQVFVCSCFQQI